MTADRQRESLPQVRAEIIAPGGSHSEVPGAPAAPVAPSAVEPAGSGSPTGFRGRFGWLILAGVVALVAGGIVVRDRMAPSPAADPVPPVVLSSTSPSPPTAASLAPLSTASIGPTIGPSIGPFGADPGSAKPPVTMRLPSAALPGQAGWRLLVRTSDAVLRIDPATGATTRTPVPRLRSTGPVSFLAGDDWAMVRPLDSVPGYLIRAGRAAEVLPNPLGSGPVLPGWTPDTVWALGSGGFQLLALDGSAVGPELTAWDNSDRPIGWPIPDGAGGMLIGAQSGFYDLTASGKRKISTGSVLAVGAAGFLVRDCSVAPCEIIVVPRAPGFPTITSASIPRGASPVGVGSLAPDGATAALAMTRRNSSSAAAISGATGQSVAPPAGDPVPRLHLIDLRTGRVLRIDIQPAAADGSFVFSPDGTYLLAVDASGELQVVTVATGKVRAMQIGSSPIQQVAVVPATVTVHG